MPTDCEKVRAVSHCDCPILGGGWCEPHQVHKTAHFVELCRIKPAYRRAWNECRGPLQRIGERNGVRSITIRNGAGRELSAILRKVGITYTSGCGCRSRAYQMDMNGPQWCRDNEETILGWMKEEADRRKLPWISYVAKMFLHRAITRAERKQKRQEHTNGN